MKKFHILILPIALSTVEGCAQSPRSNVLAKYASARHLFARLASERFLNGLRAEFFKRSPAWEVRVKRWIREPLLHFLLIGLVLFAVYDAFNSPAGERHQSNSIELTEDDLRQVIVAGGRNGSVLPHRRKCAAC